MNPGGSWAGLRNLPYWLFCMLALDILVEGDNHTLSWSLLA
jgi:hypothetical protein